VRKNWTLLVGISLVSLLVICTLFANWISPHSPLEDFRGLENLSPSFESRDGKYFLLGTDTLGRDLLSRLIYGARYCLLMGCVTVAIAGFIGIPLGMLAGSHTRLDAVISKATDIVMSFPAVLIALVVVSILGPGLFNVIIAVALTSIPSFIRLTRSQVKLEFRKDYVQAAECLGVGRIRLLSLHIFPNIVPSLLVLSSLSLGTAILESAGLSFLNLGVTPPAPEWGSMIRTGMETFLSSNPWVSTFAGLCIFLNVLAFNLIGDALRDRLDPALRGKV